MSDDEELKNFIKEVYSDPFTIRGKGMKWIHMEEFMYDEEHFNNTFYDNWLRKPPKHIKVLGVEFKDE